MIFSGKMGALVGFLFLSGVIALVILANWEDLSREWGLKKFIVSTDDRDRYRSCLQELSYFRQLSPKGKQIFIDRVVAFMHNKEFTGREGLKVTEQMQVLVSAAAVQLTFGLGKFKLGNIKSIILYPGSFFGSRGREYKGLTSASGQMLLSWEDFREGYLDPNDRYNLGLHEMSHALQLNLHIGTGLDAHFGSYIDKWKEIAQKEFDKMQTHKEPLFLRSYAKTNMTEFFAVCIEHFFETPQKFRNALPDIYNHMAVLLNQNPLNINNDYKLDEWFRHDSNRNFANIPIPAFITKNFKYSSWHWSLTLMLCAVLAGPLSMMYLYHVLVIPPYAMLLLFVLCCCIAFIQQKRFRQTEVLRGKYFFLYAFLGFGPCLFLLILWLNFIVPISGEIKEEYKVTLAVKEFKTSREYPTAAGSGYTVSLEKGAYDDVPSIRFITGYAGQEKVGFIFRRGIFGIKVLESTYYPKQ